MMATSRCIALGQRARQRSVPSLMAVRRRELRAEARGEAETWVRLPPSPTWIHSPVGLLSSSTLASFWLTWIPSLCCLGDFVLLRPSIPQH